MKEDDLNTWEVPLNLAYITYAAKDAYACYDMYRQILDMRACLQSASRNRRVHGQPQRHDQACQEGLDVVLCLFISTFII